MAISPKSAAQIFATKRRLLCEAVRGRASASSTSLSASFGLKVEDTRRILRELGVQDDG